MLLENIRKVFSRISHAAMRAGRSPGDIRLIAVTKEVVPVVMNQAVEIGLREFGESRVQAAMDKIPLVRAHSPDSDIVWHMIGHLQKNKAKAAVPLFDLIHSVGSGELAGLLNDQAGRSGKVQKILVQVKLADEPAKHGAIEENIMALIKEIAVMKNLSMEGLMTIPPYNDDPERSRPFFRRLRELREGIEKAGFRLPELSMGMSDDFEVAIEEGATMVRVGTAIFGERKREVV